MNIVNKNKKFILVGFLVIGLIILRSFILRKPDDRLTYTVNKGDLSEKVEVSGLYTASSQTEVFSPSDGIIIELYVNNGDYVEKDDALFNIESTATAEQKAIAYASYQASLTALKTAKQGKENLDAAMWTKQKMLLDAENNLGLMNERLAEDDNNPLTKDKYTQLEIESHKSSVTQTQKDFRALEKQYKEADQNIASANAMVTSTKLAYNATQNNTVYSSTNGKVLNLLKKIGDEVDAKSPTTYAPVLFIANLGNPSIIAKVNEVDSSRIQEGQRAVASFDSVRDTLFNGSVEIVDTIGTTNLGITTFDARIHLKDIDDRVKPNMTGIITIETYHKDDVISVPNTAITYQGDDAYVMPTGRNNDLIKIELGYSGVVESEVLSGLSEGTEIFADISDI